MKMKKRIECFYGLGGIDCDDRGSSNAPSLPATGIVSKNEDGILRIEMPMEQVMECIHGEG